MKLYRIENQETMHGMWYNIDGVYQPFIEKLTEGVSADLPMGFHERYFDGGFKWFSGCNNIEDMRMWFSDRDAFELFTNNYKLYQMESQQFSVEENQVLFTREGIVKQEEIPLDTIWQINNFSKEKLVIL